MSGKRFGERLKWLNSQLNRLKEVLTKIKNYIYEALQG
jgi:hypothetical protein